MRTLLEHVAQLAAVDDDWLSDHGQDRTYSTLRQLLAAAGGVLAAGQRALNSVDALTGVQRAFVARMMDSTVFTKQLAAVRELRIALDCLLDLPEGPAKEERIEVS